MFGYISLNLYLKQKFGERVQKIPLDAGLTCPNRDGSKGKLGCIYCDPQGSGTGLAKRGVSVVEQMQQGMKWAKKRYGARKFIAYFQSFSNTYAPIEKLERIYKSVLLGPDVVGVSIGTRPDCIDEERLGLIAHLFKGKMVWIELGLQSAHNETLKIINRGHTVEDFEKAVRMVKDFGFLVCAHIIFGLPGETKKQMKQTVEYLTALPVDGVKFHQLYILKNTPICRLYESGDNDILSQKEYAAMVAWSIKKLQSNVVVHRLTGDPPKQGLVEPLWSLDKQGTIKLINNFFTEI